MFKLALALAGLLAGLLLAVSAASGNQGAANANCGPFGGVHWSCADPIGDVTGGARPDIARVTYDEWGVMLFTVTFAEGSRLAHSAAFTDTVSVFLTAARAEPSTRREYLLTVSAKRPGREVLRRLPNGKPVNLMVRSGITRSSGKAATLRVTPGQIGGRGLVRWRIRSARLMLNGTPASSDYAPDMGWYR